MGQSWSGGAGNAVLGKVVVRILRGDTMEPLPGASVAVDYLPYDPRTATGAPVPVESGETDAEGVYAFRTSQDPAGQLRLTVSEGASGLPFPPKETEIRAGMDLEPRIAVCPLDTDPLVCEIADKQAFFLEQFEILNRAWGGPSVFTFDQARLILRDQRPPEDARLRAWWDSFSWAVTDLSIPPSDWPALVRNHGQMYSVFSEIPFPTIEEKDWFERCARGTPVWKAKDGAGLSVADFRLYAPSLSDYFPRDDRQIRYDLAARYLMNLPVILGCVEHKFRKKVRDVERTQKAAALTGLVTAFMLGPLAGGAGSSVILTEIGNFAAVQWNLANAEQTDIVADGFVSPGGPGVESIVAAGVALVIERAARDADPLVRDVAYEGADFAVSAAFADTQGGVLPAGASDFLSLQSLGSAGAAAAVQFVVSMMKSFGVRSAERLKEIAGDFRNLPERMVPFVLWATDVLLLEALFRAAEDEVGREGDTDAPGGDAPGAPPGGEDGAPPAPPGAPDGEPPPGDGPGLRYDPETGLVFSGDRPTGFAYASDADVVYDPRTGSVLDPRTGEPSGFFYDRARGEILHASGRPATPEEAQALRIGGPERFGALGAVGGGALLAALLATGIITGAS